MIYSLSMHTCSLQTLFRSGFCSLLLLFVFASFCCASTTVITTITPPKHSFFGWWWRSLQVRLSSRDNDSVHLALFAWLIWLPDSIRVWHKHKSNVPYLHALTHVPGTGTIVTAAAVLLGAPWYYSVPISFSIWIPSAIVIGMMDASFAVVLWGFASMFSCPNRILR